MTTMKTTPFLFADVRAAGRMSKLLDSHNIDFSIIPDLRNEQTLVSSYIDGWLRMGLLPPPP